jgi:hypothetical protein
MDFRVYLNDSEYDFVKNKDKGYVRELVQSAMLGKEPVKTPPPKNEKSNFIFTPKSSHKGEIGWCVNGHFAGVGMKTCKLCKGKVNGR